MKRLFFRATALVVAFGFMLPLFAQPARADDVMRHIIRDAPDVKGARKLALVDPASIGNGATRHVAQPNDRYVFEARFAPESFSPRGKGDQHSPVVRVDIAEALNAIAAQRATPAGFLVNYPGVVRIIRL
jgi:hypothetical protein